MSRFGLASFNRIRRELAGVVCPTCGLRTLLLNMTANRGYVGEVATPGVHCACPGGPCHPDTPRVPPALLTSPTRPSDDGKE